MHSGLEISGDVDDKTWDVLLEQVAYKKKKEEERAHKREEAQKKAKIEQEKRLQQQKEESARAMDNMLEKTLSLIGGSKKGGAPQTSIFPSVSPLPPASPTGTSTGVPTTTHPSPGASVAQPRGRSPRSQPVAPPAVADLLGSSNSLDQHATRPDGLVSHNPPAVMSPKSATGGRITSPRSGTSKK
jgi:hypothetical protein